jgi:hypothetical protein
VRWARDHTRAPGRQLELLVLLKTFQFLGYFATPIQIAAAIVAAIARRIELHAPDGTFSVAPASLYRSRAVIRHHLGIEHWNAANKRLLATRLVSLNQGRTGPNDLLNAAVEYLRRAGIELPAMRTLRRLIGRVRARFDRAFCAAIVQLLKAPDRQALDNLMVIPPGETVSGFERIKRQPPRPSLQHLAAHLSHLQWLRELPATQPLIAALGAGKVTDFAEQARAPNVAGLREHAPTRRLALLICLLHVARAECLDQVATLYLRRIHWMYGQAREDLEDWRRDRGSLSLANSNSNCSGASSAGLRTLG